MHIHGLIVVATVVAFPALAEAAQCQFVPHAVCRGCSVEATVKMKRFDRGERNRWCSTSYSSTSNYYTGIRVVKGFALGEIRTSAYRVSMSPLRAGRDTVIVEINARSGASGEPYTSRITYNVEVVEGDF